MSREKVYCLLDEEIYPRMKRGKIEPLDPKEIIGENPGLEVPGETLFSREEMEDKDGRLTKLRSWAKKNQKRIVIASTIGGATAVIVASAWMIEHIRRHRHEADITNGS